MNLLQLLQLILSKLDIIKNVSIISLIYVLMQSITEECLMLYLFFIIKILSTVHFSFIGHLLNLVWHKTTSVTLVRINLIILSNILTFYPVTGASNILTHPLKKDRIFTPNKNKRFSYWVDSWRLGYKTNQCLPFDRSSSQTYVCLIIKKQKSNILKFYS